jgi:predicted nucleic acid-binding protein
MPDEESAAANAIRLLLQAQNQAIVPAIFWTELVNVLLVAERRGRLSRENAQEILQLMQQLPIAIDPTPTKDTTASVLQLGRQHGLAAYDAAYLELAIRQELLLATLDLKLDAAARKCDVLLEIPTSDGQPDQSSL